MGNDAKAKEYRKRAMNYQNVFDPDIAFSRPLKAAESPVR
jgi:putative alpha-1,2-mannosidase